MRAVLFLVAVLFVAIPAYAQPHQYAVGQVWEFEAEEPNSNVVIAIREIERIDTEAEPLEIFHISMSAVELENALIPVVGHLPVSRETLDKSVTVQSDRRFEATDFAAGIRTWREANGGVFTISLAEIIDFLNQMMKQQEVQP